MTSKSRVGRNDPCPCGSGKKYKRCCAAIDYRELDRLRRTSEVDWFKLNQIIAYKGQIGKQRQEFCIKYSQDKSNRIPDIQKAQLAEVSAKGLSITCKKGCASCCSLYVESTIQECEAIVYYLYQHEAILAQFLDKYPLWRKRLEESGNIHKEIGKVWKSALAMKMGSEALRLNEQMNDLLGKYTKLNIPCPFLSDTLCTIYDVRPYLCVGHVSMYPPEYCGKDVPGLKFPRTVDTDTLFDLSFYYRSLSNPVVSPMALLVYEILKAGTQTLSNVPELAKIDQEFLADPEVKLAIWQNRESIFRNKQATSSIPTE